MREMRLSGSISGVWKRGTAQLMRHRQTKGPETDRLHINHRATPRLYRFWGLGRFVHYPTELTPSGIPII